MIWFKIFCTILVASFSNFNAFVGMRRSRPLRCFNRIKIFLYFSIKMYEVKAGAKKVAAKKVAAKKVATKKVATKKGGEHFFKKLMLTDKKVNNIIKEIKNKNPFNVDKKTGRLTAKKSPSTSDLMKSIINKDMAYRQAMDHLKLMGKK